MKLTVTRTGTAVFTHEEDGMVVTWTISADDDSDAIVAKLKKMLTFLGEDPAPVYQLPMGKGGVPPRVSGRPETIVQNAQNRFTGIPPVQPPSLDASVAHAVANGWELMPEGDD